MLTYIGGTGPSLTYHFLRLRPYLRPSLFRCSGDSCFTSGRQDALLDDFQLFARRIAQSFCSRSDSIQLMLYLAELLFEFSADSGAW
jgi:hypothetical protein